MVVPGLNLKRKRSPDAEGREEKWNWTGACYFGKLTSNVLFLHVLETGNTPPSFVERRLSPRSPNRRAQRTTRRTRRQPVMVENPEDPPLHNHTLHDKLVNMDGFEYMLLPGRDEDIFGKVYTCKKHSLVKSKAVGTVFVVVMDWSKESMTRLHNACANQDKPLRNRGEINAKGELYWLSD